MVQTGMSYTAFAAQPANQNGGGGGTPGGGGGVDTPLKPVVVEMKTANNAGNAPGGVGGVNVNVNQAQNGQNNAQMSPPNANGEQNAQNAVRTKV